MAEKLSVSLDKKTEQIVRRVARERNYGKRGFSLALRQIVTEWHKLNGQPSADQPQVQEETSSQAA